MIIMRRRLACCNQDAKISLDFDEQEKEKMRAQNAQLHAAVSVAGVAAAMAAIAAAMAAIAAATAASYGSGKEEHMAKTDMAVASATALVAAQCVEAAEAMGAEHEHLATLKARALKEVWNIAAVIPAEKGMAVGGSGGDGAGSGEEFGGGIDCLCQEVGREWWSTRA